MRKFIFHSVAGKVSALIVKKKLPPFRGGSKPTNHNQLYEIFNIQDSYSVYTLLIVYN